MYSQLLRLVCCLMSAASPALFAQTLVPHADGGWVTTGLPYECRVAADGTLRSFVVDGFDFTGAADGYYLADGNSPIAVTGATVTDDTLRIAAEGARLSVRFLADGPEFTVTNDALKPGSVLRLRFAKDVARIKPLGRSNEPAMPLRTGVSGALRFIAPSGASLTFGESDSYHLGASCTARPAGEAIEILMPYVMPSQEISFQLAVARERFLEDAIRVVGSTDRPDNTFWDDAPVKLHAAATNVSATAPLEATLVLRLRHYLTRQIVREERLPLTLAAGETKTLTWTLADLEPMLYAADIWIEQDGQQGFCGSPRFVFNASQIAPPPLPEDFDAFWARTLKEQAAIPLDLQMTQVKETETHVVYKFSFAGLLRYRCYGWLTVPKGATGKLPATLVLPPAGMRDQPIPYNADMVSMAININTVDVGLPAEDYDWRTWPAPYLVTGILDKNYYSLRFSYAAIARAYEVLAAHELVDATQIHVQGSSQGGGLTIIAAGLIPDAFVDAVARKPGLCRLDWNLEYLNPPFFPIGTTEAGKPAIQNTLKYFLPSHFARRITCPIDISLGIYDDVTPGVSVFCAYNAIPGDKKTLTVDANAGH